MKAVKFKWHLPAKKIPHPDRDLLIIVDFGNGAFITPGLYLNGNFVDDVELKPISFNNILAWGYYPKMPKKICEKYHYFY